MVFRGRSISLKQGLLLVVLAALLPISIAGFIQGNANWNSTQNAALGALRADARAIAERERDAFLVSNRLLVVAAGNPDIKNMTDKCSAVLKAGFEGYEPVVNFIRTDAAGRVRCSILPYRDGTTLDRQPWWIATRKARGITVSQPTIGTVSGVPIIVVALPLQDDLGRFAGTFSAGLDISKLAKSVAAAPESKEGAIAIISGKGRLVASDTPDLPFRLPSDLRIGSSGTLQSSRGTKWVYETAALSGPELFVLYAEPRSNIMSGALTQFRSSIILPLAAIILALLAIWFGTNRLVIRWLNSLRRVSDEFTKGNFAGNRQAFAGAPLELRELSDDLHDMAQVIDSRTKQLTDALEAKTQLTREVHHRVKNNLQIITSLLTMQASRMKDDVAQSALSQARARVVALALIHRLTYEQDSSDAHSTVPVAVLLEELCKQLRYSHRERRDVDLACRTDDYDIIADSAVPLALFIVEAVTNSYRHAFAAGDQGAIELSFELDGEEAVLTVKDSGRGYDVEHSAGKDLGIQLMHGFAGQLNGTATLASDPGRGSATTLTFAAPAQAG